MEFLPAERERLEAYDQATTCPECGRKGKAHWPRCSESPITTQVRYAEALQRHDYRAQAHEFGCVCPNTLGPHTHLPACRFYETPEQMAERLTEEHEPLTRADVEREIATENRAIRSIEERFK